jgi:hypothetical protein
MSDVQAHRTLVKSPPELWAELSDAESLAQHLGEFGEIRITRTEPESTVAWEGEHVRGTVTIAPSGWGTEVFLTARIAVPEPESPPPPAPPEHIEHALAVVGEDVVRIDPPPEPPEPEAEPEAPARRPGFFARLFGRAPQPEAPIQPAPEPEPPPEPYELRVVHAVVACRVPDRPAPEPPAAAAPALDADRASSVLADVLDHLGAAHHRPFSRG